MEKNAALWKSLKKWRFGQNNKMGIFFTQKIVQFPISGSCK